MSGLNLFTMADCAIAQLRSQIQASESTQLLCQGCFSFIIFSQLPRAQIFTGLLFYANVVIHIVRTVTFTKGFQVPLIVYALLRYNFMCKRQNGVSFGF